MSVTAARSSSGLTFGAAEPPQRRLDDHQRVADLVRDDGRQPSERREPLALRRFALEARDRVGHRVEGGREEPGILVLPGGAAGRRGDAPRQVAGRRHLAHRRGDGAERPRDRAGDGVAQERRGEHRDNGDDAQPSVQRIEKPQALRSAIAG